MPSLKVFFNLTLSFSEFRWSLTIESTWWNCVVRNKINGMLKTSRRRWFSRKFIRENRREYSSEVALEGLGMRRKRVRGSHRSSKNTKIRGQGVATKSASK